MVPLPSKTGEVQDAQYLYLPGFAGEGDRTTREALDAVVGCLT